MKWKIIKSDYNKETGISYVQISTKYGVFEGISKLHPDDKDIASEFEGCRYAEIRAVLKFLQHSNLILSTKINVLQNLLNNFQQRRHYNPQLKENIYLQHEIQLYIKQKGTNKEIMMQLKDMLHNAIGSYRMDREKFLESLNKKKEQTRAN